MNYAKQINEFEAEISRRRHEVAMEFAPLKAAAEALKKVNTVWIPQKLKKN